jgi:hypothetical protein
MGGVHLQQRGGAGEEVRAPQVAVAVPGRLRAHVLDGVTESSVLIALQ